VRSWGLVLIVVGLMGAFASSASGAVDVVGSWFHHENDFSQAGALDGGFSGVYDDFTAETADGRRGLQRGLGSGFAPERIELHARAQQRGHGQCGIVFDHLRPGSGRPVADGSRPDVSAVRR
jgi:hypothetical protein